MSPKTVRMLVPAGFDDVDRPSGGNHYNQRLIDELPAHGWDVEVVRIDGDWPTPVPADRAALDRLLTGLPDDAVVLVDGLIATAAPSLIEASARLRVTVLLHMPFAEAAPADAAAEVARIEGAVLRSAGGVVTTSEWTRRWILAAYGLARDRVRAAVPGVDPAPLTPESADDAQFLCVGPVVPPKGQDVVVAALAELADLSWDCTFVGALDLDPDFVTSVKAAAARAGIADRLTFADTVPRDRLAELRSRSGLLVAASRHEAYGMAVVESLATGIPAVVSDAGGHREALGQAGDGTVPGAVVPPGDSGALSVHVRRWLTDPSVRRSWRVAAAARRTELADWRTTARSVASALDAVAADTSRDKP